MTKPARKENRLKRKSSESGEHPSVRAVPVAPVVDINEPPRRRHRTINRPAKSTEEGYVTLGFRDTEEFDERLRKAVEARGFYSKADLIRKVVTKFVDEVVGDSDDREREIRLAAAKLDVDPEELIKATLDEMIKRSKRGK